jgi:hypothetical protein
LILPLASVMEPLMRSSFMLNLLVTQVNSTCGGNNVGGGDTFRWGGGLGLGCAGELGRALGRARRGCQAALRDCRGVIASGAVYGLQFFSRAAVSAAASRGSPAMLSSMAWRTDFGICEPAWR